LYVVSRELDDIPPPGVGLVTLIHAQPIVATLLAPTFAVSCVALTKLVESGVPFNCTTEPETNPEPFTVNVNEAEPACTNAGEIELTIGAGL
jgi:hypothetical protein